MMKTHAFVRENIPKVLNYDPKKSKINLYCNNSNNLYALKWLRSLVYHL